MQARGEAPPFAQKGASTLALAPKWETLRTQRTHQFAHDRLHLRPEPRRAKVKTVFGQRALCIDRQDTPTRAVTRFKQVKIHASVVQQAGCVQTGKTCPDDGKGGVGKVLAPLCKAASVGFGCLARLTA